MPALQRPPGGAELTRRQAVLAGLGGSAVLALTGCGLRLGQPDAEPTLPPPGADELARERVAEQADALATSAAAAAALRPDAARQLAEIIRQHREHATALRPVGATATTAPASPSVTAGAPKPAVTTGGATKATALGRQAEAEREGASAVEPELAKVSADVARLLASVAACRTVHADVLTRLAGGSG